MKGSTSDALLGPSYTYVRVYRDQLLLSGPIFGPGKLLIYFDLF